MLVLSSEGVSKFLKVYRRGRWSCWIGEGEETRLSLAVVRDLREVRASAGPEQLVALETDVLAGFVLARAAAGMADSTIAGDVVNLEQIRVWFGGPLWEMEPADADVYFGKVLRSAAKGTRQARSRALRVYFLFLEIRHKVQIHQMTGRVVECPIDEMNRPRGVGRAALRIPPSAVQVEALFTGWRQELATCRRFAPAARNYAASRLMADVGLRVNEASHLDLPDIKWELGPFGKLHVRKGKGARGSGPRERMVPLINNAGATLRWFVQDVWSCFDGDHTRPGAPLFCSERRNTDGSAARVGNETLRSTLAAAAVTHLPDWPERVTPHVLRHFCASQLYLGGMDLVAIQATLGHAWVSTTMNYIHVQATHIEDAWTAGQQRAAERLKGLLP
jgi:site-specific recombinase XerD